MPDPVAASPAAQAPAAAAQPAATLATSEPVVAAPAAGSPEAVAAAKAEEERVAALSPEAKAKEVADAKAKTEVEAKTKADADAKAEETRRAALTPEQRKVEDDAKAKTEADAKTKEAADRAARAPEKYELTLPDGVVLDVEVSGEFQTAAKKFGLTQEEAQEIYSIGAKATQRNADSLLSSVKTLQDGWLEASKTDKEFGGENLDKNLAIAKSAFKFATPELKKILNESRLGDHPEMLRWMFRVGKAMAEDTFVQGDKPMTRDQSEDARAKRLYPQQN